MTSNIASPIFNTLLTMFFLVIAVGCATGAFAAIQLGRAQKRYEADEAQLTAAVPYDYDVATPEYEPAEPSWTPDPGTEVAPAPEGDTHAAL